MICRLFNLGGGDYSGVQVYIDPETKRRNGVLEFSAHTWAVKPLTHPADPRTDAITPVPTTRTTGSETGTAEIVGGVGFYKHREPSTERTSDARTFTANNFSGNGLFTFTFSPQVPDKGKDIFIPRLHENPVLSSGQISTKFGSDSPPGSNSSKTLSTGLFGPTDLSTLINASKPTPNGGLSECSSAPVEDDTPKLGTKSISSNPASEAKSSGAALLSKTGGLLGGFHRIDICDTTSTRSSSEVSDGGMNIYSVKSQTTTEAFVTQGEHSLPSTNAYTVGASLCPQPKSYIHSAKHGRTIKVKLPDIQPAISAVTKLLTPEVEFGVNSSSSTGKNTPFRDSKSCKY